MMCLIFKTHVLAVLSKTSTTNIRQYAMFRNPFKKTLDIIKQDLPKIFRSDTDKFFAEHADVVIVGGGIIGASVAYWLKTRAGNGLTVAVIEKDPTYKNARRNLSIGGINQHFALPENVLLSQFSAEFLRNIKQNLNTNVDIDYRPNGYLVLASDKYAERLEQNVVMQREYGVKNELLTPTALKSRYPWLNTDDVKLGCIGSELEGQFNSWTFLSSLIKKTKEMGTMYIDAEVTGFNLQRQRDVMMEGVAPGSFERIFTLKYTTSDKEEHEIKFAGCILAAGHESSNIARLANVGVGDGILSMPLPIELRKHNVYTLEDKNAQLGINTPLLQDSSGMWVKKKGLQNEIMCGHIPLSALEINDSREEYFNRIIRPPLENRIPTFNNFEIKNIDTEYFDYNTYDDTGIIGPHPYHNNLYIAAGFGSLGYQHAPGIGRALAELIIDSRYMSIDLTRLCFDRLLTNQPMVESNMY